MISFTITIQEKPEGIVIDKVASSNYNVTTQESAYASRLDEALHQFCDRMKKKPNPVLEAIKLCFIIPYVLIVGAFSKKANDGTRKELE